MISARHSAERRSALLGEDRRGDHGDGGSGGGGQGKSGEAHHSSFWLLTHSPQRLGCGNPSRHHSDVIPVS